MVPFLQQVAAHYFAGQDLTRTCFLFPNRRSLVFFRKYLSDLVRDNPAHVPLPVPPLQTINDFFCRLGGVQVSDPLQLLLELYRVYRSHNPQAESLDDFVFWGEVMLTDFEDVDKYLADARALMQNASDLKALQGDMDYLTEGQKAAISHFLDHFRDGRPVGGVKGRFLQLWNLLYPVYRDFNAVLQEKGMAYEGKVYRSLAERLRGGTPVVDLLKAEFPEADRFVVVGLNALNECERVLLRRMRDAGVAEFVWDYVSPLLQDKDNKASLYMRGNVEEFPQAFPIDAQGLGRPEITVVSVPSAVGQAKLAPWILSQTGGGNPVETAFVLPDEKLLLPLLNSLPEQYDSVNVTMGYPMRDSAVYTLLKSAGEMQLKLRNKAGNWYVYHRPVREIFACGLVKKLATPQEAEVIRRVKAQAQYFIPLQELQGGPLLELIFHPVVTQKEASVAQNHAMERYLQEIVAYAGRSLTKQGGMLLELDFAKRCHTQLTLLQGTDLEVLPGTHLRLVTRLLEGISVPFRGEPLQGLQIMGPLETRALDFRNLVILSANEGTFPRRSSSPSFIPPELRKGFGLPTYEYQDAVWAYYFYRMIQRPQKVWLLYDSRTEGLHSGEESRFIKQLEYHFGLKVRHLTATADLLPARGEESLPKTAAHIETIRGKELSATAVQQYLECPVMFFYHVVEGLQEEKDVAESLDAGMLGNVFHHVMKRLYEGKALVTPADLDRMIKDTALRHRLIREEILDQLHSLEVNGRNLVLEQVVQDYVLRTLRYDASLLSQSGSEGFRIIGLEEKMKAKVEGFAFKGFADRVDSYRPGEVRIVDYKTGRVEESEIRITDENALAVVDKLFAPPGHKRPKITIQLYLYDLMAHRQWDLGEKPAINCIYSLENLFTAGEAPECPESSAFNRLVAPRLKEVLEEMTNPDIPFTRTPDAESCKWCAFKNLCGR